MKEGSTTIKSYSYDAQGRTTSVVSAAGTTSMSYDYEDRMTSITLPSGRTDTYTYNGEDTRTGMNSSAGTQTFKREGAGVTAPVLSDGLASYTPGVSRHTSSGSTFYGTDRQGTDSLQTSATGAVAATKVYDGFGMLVSTTGTPVGPFGYNGASGYQEDADTGLMLLGHRYYDSSTGRFVTRDPAKDGSNWYDYVGNNPLSDVDPDGFVKIIEGWRQVKGTPGSHGFLLIIDNDPNSPTYGDVWLVQLIVTEGKCEIEVTEFGAAGLSESQHMEQALDAAGVPGGQCPDLVVLENDHQPPNEALGKAYQFAYDQNSKKRVYKILWDNCNAALATLLELLGLYDKGWQGYKNLPGVWAPGFGHPWNTKRKGIE